MRLKSFFADTIEQALREAREAMGPDAMLVDSKPSGAEARHLGAYEVVICAEETGLPLCGPSTPRRSKACPRTFPG
jgi:hypothetical protein